MITVNVDVEGVPGLEALGLRVELLDTVAAAALARQVIADAMSTVLAHNAPPRPTVEVLR
jgi:hypothetical protein